MRFLTRAFNLTTRSFNLTTFVFSVLTREFELVTLGFELITRGFELVTRTFELVTRVLLFRAKMIWLLLYFTLYSFLNLNYSELKPAKSPIISNLFFLLTV